MNYSEVCKAFLERKSASFRLLRTDGIKLFYDGGMIVEYFVQNGEPWFFFMMGGDERREIQNEIMKMLKMPRIKYSSYMAGFFIERENGLKFRFGEQFYLHPLKGELREHL